MAAEARVRTAGFQRHRDATGETVTAAFAQFLERPVMADQIDLMVDMERRSQFGRNTVYVSYQQLNEEDPNVASLILSEYFRFEPYLRKAIQQVIQRRLAYVSREERQGPPREYWLGMYDVPHISRIRDLRTSKLGQLTSISGTVTRTSEVRPELLVGTFRCQQCNAIVRDVEQQFKYTEPITCPTEACQNRSEWDLLVDQSKFCDWQKIRVQENSSEIPAGSMPRTVEVVVRNEVVDRAKPGDKCIFTGTLIVIPDIGQLASAAGRVETRASGARMREGVGSEGTTGIRALGVREMTYRLCFLASTVQPAERQAGSMNIRDDPDAENTADVMGQFSLEELDEVRRMRQSPRFFSRIVDSVCPTVFGNTEIKTGVLLMLFGGVHKQATGGIKLRGDINVCIVGDPATAKSQFLKYVVSFLPRAVYTSGKASTAAGLTASVVKDPETGEFSIEAGALMLADNGVCCIDEFDKMDKTDQVAIHEAMEQQTISIAKAGIQATLNARTSILAAANPVGGRYEKRRTLRHNVNMTPAIMSRFDLFFVLLDEVETTTDTMLARHLVTVHQNRELPQQQNLFSTEQLQRYIRIARRMRPKITPESLQMIVENYRTLRQNDAGGVGKASFRITVRQLESIIRLSEALARLHLDAFVQKQYVQMAVNLLKKSIVHVDMDNVNLDDDEELRDEDLALDGEDGAAAAGAAAQGDGQQAAAERQHPERPAPMVIPYERFKQITNMIVMRLRRDEDVEREGMRQSALINDYLEQMNLSDADRETFLAEHQLVTRVIRHLIVKEHILLVLRNLEALPDAEAAMQEDDDPVLVVHPNYVPEHGE